MRLINHENLSRFLCFKTFRKTALNDFRQKSAMASSDNKTSEHKSMHKMNHSQLRDITES